MVDWPFTRAKPAGWAFGEILTSAQMNALDINAAQAADGLTWSDLAHCRLWPYSHTISGAKVVVQGYQSSSFPILLWKLVGTSDLAQASHGGFQFVGTTDAALMTTPLCAAVASDGLNIVIGGNGGASATKYAYATGGMNTALSTANSTDNTSATINTVCYIAGSVNLFVAGLSDGDIETSPTGATWTARTTPNSNARRRIATNGTDLLVSVSSASTDAYLTSTNATSWTERAFPTSSTGGYHIEYSAWHGLWFASNGQTGALYKSDDAITWTNASPNITCRGPMVAAGRALCMLSENFSPDLLIVSVDEGASWHTGSGLVAGSAVGTCFTRGFNNNQLALVTDDDIVRLSAHVADPAHAATQP